jgi:hypothetical protein
VKGFLVLGDEATDSVFLVAVGKHFLTVELVP